MEKKNLKKSEDESWQKLQQEKQRLWSLLYKSVENRKEMLSMLAELEEEERDLRRETLKENPDAEGCRTVASIGSKKSGVFKVMLMGYSGDVFTG